MDGKQSVRVSTGKGELSSTIKGNERESDHRVLLWSIEREIEGPAAAVTGADVATGRQLTAAAGVFVSLVRCARYSFCLCFDFQFYSLSVSSFEICHSYYHPWRRREM